MELLDFILNICLPLSLVFLIGSITYVIFDTSDDHFLD